MTDEGKELMIPGMDDLKQQYGYAMVPKGDAGAMWSDMLAGMPSGAPPRIKLNGKQFMLVDSSGEETPYPLKKLVEGPDGNLYMQALFLAARPKIQKAWYLKAYSPGQEPEAPDCFSNDGERPDPAIKIPQCDTCAECPKNAWGSGVDQNNMATDGKACRDVKTFALFVPGFGIYSFRIPPGSFKNWGRLGKHLARMGLNPMMVKYLVGFDAKASYPVLVFMFGGVVPETDDNGQSNLQKIQEKARSPEVMDIINNKISGGASTAAKTDAPKAAPEKAEEVEDDLGLDDDAPAGAATTGPVEQAVEVDASGTPHYPQYHTANKSKTADDCWRVKPGLNDTDKAIVALLREGETLEDAMAKAGGAGKKAAEQKPAAAPKQKEDDLGLGGGSDAGGEEAGGDDDIMSDDDALAAELGL